MKQKRITVQEIEAVIYQRGGLFERVIKELEKIGNKKARELTGKRQQYIDTIKRQFRNPEKYELPKVSTLIDMARKLGVE